MHFDLSRGFWYSEMVSVNGCMDIHTMNTLQGTNISPTNGILKMIFLFPRWDMLIPWRVGDKEMHSTVDTKLSGKPLDVLAGSDRIQNPTLLSSLQLLQQTREWTPCVVEGGVYRCYMHAISDNWRLDCLENNLPICQSQWKRMKKNRWWKDGFLGVQQVVAALKYV